MSKPLLTLLVLGTLALLSGCTMPPPPKPISPCEMMSYTMSANEIPAYCLKAILAPQPDQNAK